MPNGSHGPGDYLQAKSGPELVQILAGDSSTGEVRRVGTEEEVFDEEAPEKEGTQVGGEDLEKGPYNHGNLGGTTAVATPVPAHVTNPGSPQVEEETLGQTGR